ncbi:hypothetical protein N7508_007559 [Penicillium antarcticum]|uniref:uncharacterized protein n=1 Tax=Penicillium antarcticum TaxID=416450 RepID=UPI00238CFC15|nr:uncharacterized protein N7508_007559 [Penicillium antarcticum]KAJ5297310.1 hypothetical protein N7508_007559 [Penicillium antarcticum]
MISSPQDHRPIVISGPSGVGKGTLVQKLFDKHPGTFGFTVSHTTRKPRLGEVEGVAYFFVSLSEFSSLCAQGALMEHAYFSGNYYGTSKQSIDDQASKGARGTENEEDIQKRLTQAQVELDYADSQGSHDKIIVNDSIESAYGELDMFVFGST